MSIDQSIILITTISIAQSHSARCHLLTWVCARISSFPLEYLQSDRVTTVGQHRFTGSSRVRTSSGAVRTHPHLVSLQLALGCYSCPWWQIDRSSQSRNGLCGLCPRLIRPTH